MITATFEQAATFGKKVAVEQPDHSLGETLMTELDEVAAAMLPAYLHWIEGTPRGNCMAASREYVRQQMSDEGETLRDNVAYSLFRMACPMVNV
jgi:hypothetical protein